MVIQQMVFKTKTYQLNYSNGGLYLKQDNLDNMDYIELTITTVNKDGVTKEMNLNVSSNGQVDTNSSDAIGNNTGDNVCPICGKALKPNSSVHTDGSSHTDEEIYAWGVKTGRITPDNNVKDNKKSNTNTKTPTEEPLPPSEDSTSDGTSGLYGLLINLFKNYR